MHFELFPLIVWIALWIVNAYSKFQVNISNNNRDIANSNDHSNNNNVKTVAITQVFSENSRAKDLLL